MVTRFDDQCFLLVTPFHVAWAGIRHNTIHVQDVAGASWAAAVWMAEIGREAGDKMAGEDIYFANEKTKIQDVKGVPDPKAKLTAPLFNLVSGTQCAQTPTADEVRVQG